MKTCCTCKTIKEETGYYRDRSQLDGRRRRCKMCCKKSAPAEMKRYLNKIGYKHYSKQQTSQLLEERTKEILDMIDTLIRDNFKDHFTYTPSMTVARETMKLLHRTIKKHYGL